MKTNGHDTSASRVNGHGTASPSQAALQTPLQNGKAASDDTPDLPTAAAASSAAAGKERDVCAEVAKPAKGAKQAGSTANRSKPAGDAPGDEDALVDIPPGAEPLPTDGPGFVDAMHAHVDLYLACARLVKSKDEKIAQRMVERLLEMSYGKSPAPQGDDMAQIVFDAPRPIRD
jgi:hypothetical protein